MRRLFAVLVAAHLALAPAPATAAEPTWESWEPFPGVFDVDGPRSDGSLIVAGSAALYLVDPAGAITPFSRGPDGYHDDPGAEAYLATSPGGHVGAARCDFVRDETFVLRLHAPVGVTRVTANGDASKSFANVSGASALNGIAFDTTGAFDHRLLVSGPSGGNTVVLAIDCTGATQVISRSAPVLEGGLAVAPSGFGLFGGALIAPDELSGKIYAIAASGAVSLVAKPLLPTGGDIGVEGVGFVPSGFMSRGGAVYYADRLTTNNPHPGTDTLLRMSSEQLAAAGVQEGDLLAATEGGATLVGVHCATQCTVLPVISTPTRAHGEGHLAFTLKAAQGSPSAATPSRTSRTSFPLLVGALSLALVLALAVAIAVVVAIRRRRP